MCGIAGYIGNGDKNTLERMTRSLSHRGPDDEGFFIQERVGLGHRRLSIIDTSQGGRQPMNSHDHSAVIVFNGEIYNYRELKEEIQKKHPYQFQSSSDTEVILRLYELYGVACFEKLNGMFALAIYDCKKNLLVLARDRLGKKPLYYTVINDTLLFGSELKALREHPLFKADMDSASFRKYLLYEYVPTPHTIFKNVFKLNPGTYAIWSNKQLTHYTFWKPSFTHEAISQEEALMALDRHLERSVRQRLIADVPLGIFLSGGIDSSTIAYYAQKASLKPIQTFSIGFGESSYDESSYAREVASFLGTEHHEQIFSPQDALRCIEPIAQLLDEPLADASILPTYLLSQFTRQHVTVALGGDGSDELFAGYPTIPIEKITDIYTQLPRALRMPMENFIARLLPKKDTYLSLQFAFSQFQKGLNVANNYRYQHWMGSFTDADQTMLLTPQILSETNNADLYTPIDTYQREASGGTRLDRLLYSYLRTYLMDGVLVKVDRASMYNSLEVRAPFLDYELVQFAMHLPSRFKLRGRTTKYILKELMKKKLPPDAVFRKKQGFAVPLNKWLRHELTPLVDELLSEPGIEKQGFFKYDYVRNLIAEHRSLERDNRKQIWTLLMFQMWYNKHLSK